MALTAAQIASYDKEGYAIVRGAFSAARTDALATAVSSLYTRDRRSAHSPGPLLHDAADSPPGGVRQVAQLCDRAATDAA